MNASQKVAINKFSVLYIIITTSNICQNKSRMGSPQLGLAGVEIDPSEEEGLEGVLSRVADCIGIPHSDLLK